MAQKVRGWASRQPKADPRVEVMEKQSPFRGYFQVDVYRLRHRKYDGSWSPKITREVFERGHAASVLLYDPDRDEVVLIEQFRTGAYAAGLDPWLVEVVAGIIEDGEDPETVVRREAVEEAGVEIHEMVSIGDFIVTPGGSSETLRMYCGRVDSSNAGGHFGIEAEGEDIRAIVLPAEQAFERLEKGEFRNMNVVTSLQWLLLHRDDLRRQWTA